MLNQDASITQKRTYLRDYQPSPFVIEQVLLQINLCNAEVVVTAELHITRSTSASAISALHLHGEDLTLQTIFINGRTLQEDEYRCNSQGLTVFSVPDQFTLTTAVLLSPEKNTQLMGLYRSRDFLCTQCEPEGFRRITYFFDRPDVLARYRVVIQALKQQYPFLLSNGNVTEQKEFHDENGRLCHQWIWDDPYVKPCYLFAMVAGDFDCLTDYHTTSSHKKIALHIYVEKGQAQQAKFAMQALKAAMAWDERVYGCEYDLEAYRIVAIDDFNMGAMENKGLNIFNSKYVLADVHTATDQNILSIFSVVSHEYFHNWSGNRVTCRDWFQLSLKEGLTIFRDQSFLQDTFSHALMRIKDVLELKAHQFTEDQSTLAHSIRPESYLEINNFYTATIYNKGAEVLRMLQTWMGESSFNQAIRAYFKKFDGQAVTIEDLLMVMQAHSKQPLEAFRSWYDQIGTPRVSIEHIDYSSEKQQVQLRMRQTLSHSIKNAIDVVPIPIQCVLFDAHGTALTDEIIFLLEEKEQIFTIENIASHPIPSFFRNFSAPVNYVYAYSIEDWILLAKYDTDGFNQWNAFQECLLHVIKTQMHFHQTGNNAFIFPEWLHELVLFYLHTQKQDTYFLAELLTVPRLETIFDKLSVEDPEHMLIEVCYALQQGLIQHLAASLQADWKRLYAECVKELQTQSADKTYSLALAGWRRLKNTSLFYLSYLPEYRYLAIEQFNASLGENMTDTLSALTCLALQPDSAFQQALRAFSTNFLHDRLILDKWLMVQAMVVSLTTLDQVKTLMHSSAFDFYNPNRVHALIGSFVERNPVCFHHPDGSGYRFLAEMIIKIDQFNSNLAARLVKPLTGWPRYDSKRQSLMQEQLNVISQHPSLSKDVRELIAE